MRRCQIGARCSQRHVAIGCRGMRGEALHGIQRIGHRVVALSALMTRVPGYHSAAKSGIRDYHTSRSPPRVFCSTSCMLSPLRPTWEHGECRPQRLVGNTLCPHKTYVPCPIRVIRSVPAQNPDSHAVRSNHLHRNVARALGRISGSRLKGQEVPRGCHDEILHSAVRLCNSRSDHSGPGSVGWHVARGALNDAHQGGISLSASSMRDVLHVSRRRTAWVL